MEIANVVCNMCRNNLAWCWCDGEPLCFDCLERWWERLQALEIHPGMAHTLPPLVER